jgi:hypothetical protein
MGLGKGVSPFRLEKEALGGTSICTYPYILLLRSLMPKYNVSNQTALRVSRSNQIVASKVAQTVRK